jgi:hypothetical protein
MHRSSEGEDKSARQVPKKIASRMTVSQFQPGESHSARRPDEAEVMGRAREQMYDAQHMHVIVHLECYLASNVQRPVSGPTLPLVMRL